MAEFACRVGTDGGIAERSVEAASADRAREILAGQGFEVFGVRRSGGFGGRLSAWLAPATASPSPRAVGNPASAPPVRRREAVGAARSWTRRRHVPASVLLQVADELAALVRAGLPLLKCLDILRQRRSGTPPGDVLDRVRDRIAGGESLSAAFAREDDASRIPRLFVTSIAIGESSGDLEGALRRYAQHLQRAQALRARVRAALLYPAALFTVSLLVIAILIGFVLPRFADFYATYESALPLPTRVLMGIASFAQGSGLLIAGLVLVVGGAIAVALRTDAGRRWRASAGFRVPLLGELRRLYHDIEASRTMATLLRGGAPLTEALSVAAEGTENSAYRGRLQRVGELVRQGTSLHAALEAVGLMDATGLEMVEVGESTGSLEDMLGHVAQTYDEILDRRLNTAVGMLEPAVLVSMGLFLAAVLLSLYLPLFSVVQVVG